MDRETFCIKEENHFVLEDDFKYFHYVAHIKEQRTQGHHSYHSALSWLVFLVYDLEVEKHLGLKII